ncbi:MAG: 50S ribosomal protein L15 [Gammaproteobacteria bacterium]|jgi:large subunit ribosomal protein L15|nr:50S ribosomal protein L15 [Gammaproteobacteria bacterium]|tara:strand:+ start:1905 stop:2339 length:435 start_codon:yes stop_codon:yes gene_type:complete
MRLNTISGAEGSRRTRKRVGRGIGSGLGKTAGRGHKGQKSRSGSRILPGFEGGQQPLQRRLPKFGFTSKVGRTTGEVTLSEVAAANADVVTLDVLKEADLVSRKLARVKVILSGSIDKAVTVQGLGVTKGARAAIEAAGGKVED